MNGQDKVLAELLKEQQHKKKLSLRKISTLVGIDVSTLSRIFNQKQKPQIKHLEKLAEVLEISLNEILVAAGYELGQPSIAPIGKAYTLYSPDTDLFEMCSMIEGEQLTKEIDKELEGYSRYMEVDEGKTMILNNLETKLRSVGQIGPVIDRIRQMYEYFQRPDIPVINYILLGSGLLYFIIASDVIPDFIFPLGFVDDAIAIKMIWSRLQPFL